MYMICNVNILVVSLNSVVQHESAFVNCFDYLFAVS